MVKTKIETVDLTDEELIGASLLKTRTSEPFASNYTVDPECKASIHVRDVGLIDMPLKESQARQLIAKAHPPAPHGHGGNITTDASAGKIWELNQHQFDFGEVGEWPPLLSHVCNVVNPRNSWLNPVDVVVEKMVIYEKGATYKTHTDIEKSKGMFGTCIVSLPSKHEGGDMLFEYGGQKPRRYKSCLKT
ncbi:hypothetical protein LCI18_004268 [Fusarium solani-melongenae]|uniref:Uncharacterized protein n=1 Tax=Fusarium solani subsp. cucurbitae TaxID=2747967 RepID=A0ACD3YZP6_FUSSC|nr:hypothetical protein LCI18_004268 [Fusarium solani-melongenae]